MRVADLEAVARAAAGGWGEEVRGESAVSEGVCATGVSTVCGGAVSVAGEGVRGAVRQKGV